MSDNNNNNKRSWNLIKLLSQRISAITVLDDVLQ